MYDNENTPADFDVTADESEALDSLAAEILGSEESDIEGEGFDADDPDEDDDLSEDESIADQLGESDETDC